MRKFVSWGVMQMTVRWLDLLDVPVRPTHLRLAMSIQFGRRATDDECERLVEMVYAMVRTERAN